MSLLASEVLSTFARPASVFVSVISPVLVLTEDTAPPPPPDGVDHLNPLALPLSRVRICPLLPPVAPRALASTAFGTIAALVIVLSSSVPSDL